MAVDVNNYSGPVSNTRLTIPTHVSPAGGQATHPSIVKFDTPWNGYNYWMGVTPYPASNDAHEDPNIVASLDGTNWVVPAGLTNPLDNAPGSPGAYNSDINLVFRADENTLYAFWRTLDRSLGSNQEKLYYRSSTNGTTWSAKTLVMQVTTPAKGQLLSPKFRWTGTAWQVWVVDDVPSPSVLRRYTSTGATPTAWSAPVACAITNLSAAEDLWHFDFVEVAGQYIGLANMQGRDSAAADYWLRLATSPDGLAWTLSENLVIPKVGQWHNLIYKSTLLPVIDQYGNVDFDVWYAGMLTGPPIVWNIMRTRVEHIADVIAPTAPGITSSEAYEGGGISFKWSESIDDVGVAAYRIRRNGVEIGTTSGNVREFMDLGTGLGTSYTYRVGAIDAAGNLTWGDTTLIATAPYPTPAVPDNSAPGDTPEVYVRGNGDFAGQSAAISEYTVTEDATPISLADIGGGVGSIDFTALEDDAFDGSIRLRRQPFELYDPTAGVQAGVIDSINFQDGIAKVAGFPSSYTLVSRKQSLAFSGTLSAAFYYYFALGGITDGIVIDSALSLEAIHVDLPPWNDEVWRMIRSLATVHGLEVSAVAGTYIIRPLRARELDFTSTADVSFDVGVGEAAAKVTVEYQDREWQASGVLYPDMSQDILTREILSVSAGEVFQTNIPVNAWLATVEQPSHVLSLPFDTTPSSAYSVVDKDNVPVSPTDWRNSGGNIIAEIGEDGRSIDLTIMASHTQSRAPYRIASVSKDGEFAWGTLYIRGSGIFFTEKELTVATGADTDVAPADSEVRFSNPMIGSTEDAVRALCNVALRRAGFEATISVTSQSVNRRGRLGNVLGPTFDEFASLYPTDTFDSFVADFPTQTFDEFDASMLEGSRADFENQAFGGVAGARTRYRDAMYRVETATISPDEYQWTALADTTFDEFDAEWGGGVTFDQFAAEWGPNATFDDFDAAPLWRA